MELVTAKENIQNITYEQGSKELKKNVFKNEKEFVDHIEENISDFTSYCLNFKYKSHKREYPVTLSHNRIKLRPRRCDLMIETICGKKILIECKTPSCVNDNAGGLGQLLCYGAAHNFLKYKIHLLILLSTVTDHLIIETIRQYNLPILFIAMDDEKTLFSSIEHFRTEDKTEENGKI